MFYRYHRFARNASETVFDVRVPHICSDPSDNSGTIHSRYSLNCGSLMHTPVWAIDFIAKAFTFALELARDDRG